VDAARSTVVAPAQAVAGGAVLLVATARDADGNPLAGRTAAFAVTGSSNTVSSATASTAADGTASVTLSSTRAEAKTVSVQIDGVAIAATALVSFVAGPPAALAFSVLPADAVAGDAFSATISLEDAFGNPVTSASGPVSVALRGGNPSAVLLGTTSAIAPLGQAEFTDLAVELAAAGYTLVASAAGLADVTSPAFAITAAAVSPAASEVAAAAPGAVAGASVALTATVRDRFDNAVPGATVTFAATGSGNTLEQPSTATDASGQATGSITSTLAEAKTVSGSVGGGTPFAGAAAVSFGPGAPSPAASTLVASPGSVDADGTTIGLTATARDAFGNAVPGATLTLSSTGQATLVQGGATDAGGVTTGSIASLAVGPQTVSAVFGGTTIASAGVVFLTLDPDGDGVPKPDDAFPNDPTRFAAYENVPLLALGGAFSAATAVNGSNLVVGLSEDGLGSLVGATWVVTGTSSPAGTQLSPIAGFAYSAAYGVDASGAAVGESEKGANVYVPVVWTPGVSAPAELPLGAFSSPSAAYGISGGRIVGEATSGTATTAVLWASSSASPVELVGLGGDRTAAYAVSGSFVVGESVAAAPGSEGRGVFWTLDGSGNPGAAIALAPLAGHASSIALDVDATGRIVGESTSAAGVVHAVYWAASAPNAPVDLGSGSAQGVSATGRVAGHGGLPMGPLLWDVRNPALLEGVLDEPFLFAQAYGINGANVIVGVHDGRAFAAVPVSAP
jgi:hypothetical protein